MMRGIKSAALASVLVLAAGSMAWAESPSSTGQGGQSSATQQQSAWGQSSPGSVSADTQQKIRQSLEQSGFKDIRVIPESFVVRAQAPDGSRIVMLLSPDELTGVVMSTGSQGMQGQGMLGSSSMPYSSQSNRQNASGAAPSTTQQQAQQELSRYGYTNMQDVTPMRGWVADATKNGEQVRVLLSDNGLVATFPGR
jgi:hypothetical protein